MEQEPTHSPTGEHEKQTTLAELIFPLSDPHERRALEHFRVAFEATHGPTDLTRRYTCLWPGETQAWLYKHETNRYFEGLPPFVQAFLLEQFRAHAGLGRLDELPAEWIRLYVERHRRNSDREGPSR